MVTLIFPVYSTSACKTAYKSLSSILPMARVKHHVFIITNDQMFLKCRKDMEDIIDDLPPQASVNVDFLVYSHDKNPYNKAKELLEKPKYVFLWGGVLLPYNTITRLLADYAEHPNAGFITGNTDQSEPCWANDIYLDAPRMTMWADHGEGLVEIDTYPICGMLLDYQNFMAVDFNSQLFNESKLDTTAVGIILRRLGYTNYLDKNLKYRLGVNI